MPSELSVHAVQKGPMEFSITDGEHQVTIDYPLPGTPGADGDLAGMTPLRLLLASLAGCSGSSVAALLRRDGERVEVAARGRRRDEHPTVITDIDLAFTVVGDVDPERVRHALELSEAHICPVWAMLKAGTPVTSSFTVVAT
jgi:putative redox protein